MFRFPRVYHAYRHEQVGQAKWDRDFTCAITSFAICWILQILLNVTCHRGGGGILGICKLLNEHENHKEESKEEFIIRPHSRTLTHKVKSRMFWKSVGERFHELQCQQDLDLDRIGIHRLWCATNRPCKKADTANCQLQAYLSILWGRMTRERRFRGMGIMSSNFLGYSHAKMVACVPLG